MLVVIEARQPGPRQPQRAGRQYDFAALVRLTVEFYHVAAYEPGAAHFDRDTQSAQITGTFVLTGNRLALVNVGHHLRHVGRSAHLQAKACSLPGLVYLLGRVS